MSRKDIKAKIKFQLVARAAGRCEFPGCNKALYEDELTKGPGNISNCAHIIPYAEDGPRGKETKHERPADINSEENLILLCPEHHKLIDSSSSEYPASELRKYKREHEERMALATEIQLERRAYIVRYTVPIAQNIPSVNIDEARLAMLPDLLYPASREPVDLSLDSISPFSDNASYEEAVENLRSKFCMSIQQKLKTCHSTRFAVFPMAPMPLLIQLGSLLGDVVNAVVYQKQRDSGWLWDEGAPDRDFTSAAPSETTGKKPVLMLMLTAEIDGKLVKQTLGEDVAIWKISSDYHDYDCISKRYHLKSFKATARKVLDEVLKHYPNGEELHVFPIMPSSACVEFGRIRTASHNPWVIYERTRDTTNFVKTISIK